MKKILGLFLLFFTTLPCFAYTSEPYYNRPSQNSQLQSDFASYLENIQAKLQKNWIAPDFLPEGHIKVLFKIDKNGDVIEGDILESSGNVLYDESAINAIHKSEPFGKFPEHTSREILAVNYTFSTSLIKADKVQYYSQMSDKYFREDKPRALEFITNAIIEAKGDENSYFLYKKRGKIQEAMGNHLEAKYDFERYEKLKAKADIKRVHALKHLVETEDNAFAYYYLAYAYERIGDYENAIWAINEAIARTDLNHQYKRYRDFLIKAQNKEN